MEASTYYSDKVATSFFLFSKAEGSKFFYLLSRYVVYQTNYNIGYLPENYPHYLLKNRNLKHFPKVKKGLCLFGAYKRRSGDHRSVRELMSEWCNHMNIQKRQFKGVKYTDVPYFEDYFDCSINIYDLQESGQVYCVYRSPVKGRLKLHLNIHKQHVSLITKFSNFCKTFQCRSCQKLFGKLKAVRRHEKICKMGTRKIYKCGFYDHQKTVFEELETVGIHVPEELRIDHSFACFDIESVLIPVNSSVHPNTEKIQWTKTHVPVSVSIADNIENDDSGHPRVKCLINKDPEKLALEFAKHLYAIKHERYTQRNEVLIPYSNELEAKIYEENCELAKVQGICDSDRQRKKLEKLPKFENISRLKRLRTRLYNHILDLNVLSFNGGRYDFPILRKFIASYINLCSKNTDIKPPEIVKIGNQYKYIRVPGLRFLGV